MPSSSMVTEMQNQYDINSTPVDSKTTNNDQSDGDYGDDSQPLIIKCGGCGDTIADRYYLLTADRQWHCRCLKCCQCGQQLEYQMTCFSRNGLIYCKQDYYRLFWWQKCVRCLQVIQPKQLVMRISVDDDDNNNNSDHNSNSHYYHVQCFTCVACDQQLKKGDHFGRHNTDIYCHLHYKQVNDNECHNYHHNLVNASHELQQQQHQRQCFTNGGTDSDDICDKASVKSMSDSYHEKQSKHHRKRKTKLSQKFIDKLTSLSPNHSPNGSQCDSPSTTTSSTLLTSLSSLRRPKRNRTSFKHQQLRAMKQYFNLNHNPDSKDLKQLSQRTGLAKRVLQVWFQNQRAKWRRSLLRQQSSGPQIVEECQPLTELNEYALSTDEEQTIIEEEQWSAPNIQALFVEVLVISEWCKFRDEMPVVLRRCLFSNTMPNTASPIFYRFSP
ncbi:LIM/homeobox protein Lhx9-like [Oppia nitens]|uniref:LIM/homeobox protein Lhx9-like n=1 Tax=Oppia nitens TaxID=1686743 RepID=UPI0023DA4ECC|nr:LIM/homeobox protein Lhx9-like [Oppia nitens]